MYNRLFKDDDKETGTDKFKGLLIAFILGNVIIWMVPEIMAQMDDQPNCGSQHIGYLPDNVLTREKNPSGGPPGQTQTLRSTNVVFIGGTVGTAADWDTALHGHNVGDVRIDHTHGGSNHGRTSSHSHEVSNGNLLLQNIPYVIELYNFFPLAYGDNHDTCPLQEGASYASRTLHSIVQTILFVVKIIMVLGVIGAVGVMRLR